MARKPPPKPFPPAARFLAPAPSALMTPRCRPRQSPPAMSPPVRSRLLRPSSAPGSVRRAAKRAASPSKAGFRSTTSKSTMSISHSRNRMARHSSASARNATCGSWWNSFQYSFRNSCKEPAGNPAGSFVFKEIRCRCEGWFVSGRDSQRPPHKPVIHGGRMKRRRFVTLLAGAPIAGSAGYLSSTVTRANGSNDPAKTAKAAVDATPIPAIDIQSAALLVMDYQLAWIATLSDSDALLARAAQAIAIARSHGMQVAYCRVALTPADYAAIPDRNLIFTQLASKPGALDEDAPEMAIDDRVAPQPGDKVIRKTRVGAFARVDLDEWLQGSGIDTLILAGLSTVCDAADRDYRLIVLADACADTDPEIQDELMTKVFPQRAQVITTADL